MSATIIEDAKNYTIEWDGDIDGIVFTRNEYVSGQTFRDACEAMLDAIKRKNSDKVLTERAESTPTTPRTSSGCRPSGCRERARSGSSTRRSSTRTA